RVHDRVSETARARLEVLAGNRRAIRSLDHRPDRPPPRRHSARLRHHRRTTQREEQAAAEGSQKEEKMKSAIRDCPCGSGARYSACCFRFHKGAEPPDAL